MRSFVGERIGVNGCTEQAQSDHISLDAITVFAIGDQGNAMVRLTKVYPAVTGNFKPRLIPRRIPVSWPRDCAEGRFGPTFVSSNIQREDCAEKMPAAMPLNFCANLNNPFAIIQSVLLDNLDLVEASYHLYRRSYRPRFNKGRR